MPLLTIEFGIVYMDVESLELLYWMRFVDFVLQMVHSSWDGKERKLQFSLKLLSNFMIGRWE